MISEAMNPEALRQNLLGLMYCVRTEPDDVNDEILRIVGLATVRGWQVDCQELAEVVSDPVRIFCESLGVELVLRTDDDKKTIIASIE